MRSKCEIIVIGASVLIVLLLAEVDLDVPVVLVEEPLEPVVRPDLVEGVGEDTAPPADVVVEVEAAQHRELPDEEDGEVEVMLQVLLGVAYVQPQHLQLLQLRQHGEVSHRVLRDLRHVCPGEVEVEGEAPVGMVQVEGGYAQEGEVGEGGGKKLDQVDGSGAAVEDREGGQLVDEERPRAPHLLLDVYLDIFEVEGVEEGEGVEQLIHLELRVPPPGHLQRPQLPSFTEQLAVEGVGSFSIGSWFDVEAVEPQPDDLEGDEVPAEVDPGAGVHSHALPTKQGEVGHVWCMAEDRGEVDGRVPLPEDEEAGEQVAVLWR